MTRSQIEVRELKPQPIHKAECYPHPQGAVLLLDGRAWLLSADTATQLAFDLCSALEAREPRQAPG